MILLTRFKRIYLRFQGGHSFFATFIFFPAVTWSNIRLLSFSCCFLCHTRRQLHICLSWESHWNNITGQKPIDTIKHWKQHLFFDVFFFYQRQNCENLPRSQLSEGIRSIFFFFTHGMKSTMFLFCIPNETTVQSIANLPTTILSHILGMRESGSHFVFLFSWMAPVKSSRLRMELIQP